MRSAAGPAGVPGRIPTTANARPITCRPTLSHAVSVSSPRRVRSGVGVAGIGAVTISPARHADKKTGLPVDLLVHVAAHVAGHALVFTFRGHSGVAHRAPDLALHGALRFLRRAGALLHPPAHGLPSPAHLLV